MVFTIASAERLLERSGNLDALIAGWKAQIPAQVADHVAGGSALKPRILFHVVAVLVLIAAVAAAETPKKKAMPATPAATQGSRPQTSDNGTGPALSTGRSQRDDSVLAYRTTGRNPGNTLVSDREPTNSSTPEAGVFNGMTVSRRPHSELQAANAERNSAHDTESSRQQQ